MAFPAPALELVHLACRRGGRALFRGVNLALPAGRMAWLRGGNGRGKSSLLRLAAGLARPDAGRVLWQGAPLHANASFHAQRAYVAHAHALNDDLRAAEALRFLARVSGRDAGDASISNALARMDLLALRDAPVRRLSQGQRRRLALARLALEPRAGLWLLDEPFDALDARAADALRALLHEHLRADGCALIASHQPIAAAAFGAIELDLDAHAALA
jgi:heme exporter protein A